MPAATSPPRRDARPWSRRVQTSAMRATRRYQRTCRSSIKSSTRSMSRNHRRRRRKVSPQRGVSTPGVSRSERTARRSRRRCIRRARRSRRRASRRWNLDVSPPPDAPGVVGAPYRPGGTPGRTFFGLSTTFRSFIVSGVKATREASLPGGCSTPPQGSLASGFLLMIPGATFYPPSGDRPDPRQPLGAAERERPAYTEQPRTGPRDREEARWQRGEPSRSTSHGSRS